MSILMWVRVHWDRAAAGASVVLGIVALFIGWLGTSGSVYVAEQLPYIVSGGLTGIFFLGIGAVLWLSADLRDEWRELRALRELHTALLLPRQEQPLTPEQPQDRSEPVVEVLASANQDAKPRRSRRLAGVESRPAIRRNAPRTASGEAL